MLTTSLQLSKKLSEIGVKTESYFWHFECLGKNHIHENGYEYTKDGCESKKLYPAYTLSELPAVLKEVGEIKSKDIPILKKEMPDLQLYERVFWEKQFLNFCQTSAQNPTQQGWEKADEELMEEIN